MKELLTNNFPLIIASLGAFFAGGWFMWSRKKKSITADLANKEFHDVATMVETYTNRLAELSQDITKLHQELSDVKQKQLEIEEENRRLKKENNTLRTRIKNLENEQRN